MDLSKQQHVRLEPRDEFTHPIEAAKNFNESMYINLFDPERKAGGWFRVGNRPNEGHAEVSCCVYFPDGRVGFMFQRPKSPATMPLPPAACVSISSSRSRNCG